MALPRTQTRYPNGTTQGESKNTDPANHADPKRLTDPVRACMHTSSVGLTAFKKVRLKGSAPGFIVSHSQEKWKWTAGSSQSTGSLGTSPSQKSGFQVQVRASTTSTVTDNASAHPAIPRRSQGRWANADCRRRIATPQTERLRLNA